MKEFKFRNIYGLIDSKVKALGASIIGEKIGENVLDGFVGGIEEADWSIQEAIIADLKRRSKELRKLVKGVTYETRESHNADYLDQLIKDWSDDAN